MYHHIVDGSPMACIVETSLRPERIAFSVLARHIRTDTICLGAGERKVTLRLYRITSTVAFSV